jgi:type IV secretory pathway VirB10-like protein
MRLGQLARKLSVRPSQIVDILAKHQQFLEDGSNAKLSDDLVKQIVLHFAPDRLNEIMAVQTQETEPEPQPEPETVVAEIVVEKIESQPEVVVETKPEVMDESETIRAPKVELAGLKVLGKIELPAPRKKEEPKAEGENQAEQKPKRELKDRPRKPVERTEKQWRNPVAQQRDAEAREKEERRKKALEEEKERKRINYLNKIKTQHVKAVRIYDETDEVQVELKPEQKPRTWVGRFLKWLNT